MNKRQKEVEKAKLKQEKQILDTLKRQYQRAARDIAGKIRFHTEKIDALLSEWDSLDEKQKSVLRSQIYQRDYQLMLRRQIDRILERMNHGQHETISQYLEECHELAWAGTLYDLHGQQVPLMLPLEQEEIVEAAALDPKVSDKLYGAYVVELKQHVQAEISRGISAGLLYGEIARNLMAVTNVGLNKAMRIVRTEGHRVQQEGHLKAQRQAKEAGADIVKQWDSTLDGRTRPTHRKLDGQTRELEEPFEAEGKTAMHPGDFGIPGEDINCRCTLLQRARWALDEDELKTLKGRAAYFGLDKTKDFADFREKYQKTGHKAAKGGIMKVAQVVSGHSGTPKQSEPNAVIDHANKSNEVDARAFYDGKGMKSKEIHATNHGNPKQHPFGKHGEHVHEYEWDDDGNLERKTIRELRNDERKDNGDIL